MRITGVQDVWGVMSMVKCIRCKEEILPGQTYCESDRCVMETKEYEDFVDWYGNYCLKCFHAVKQQKDLPPPPFENLPICPRCQNNNCIVPMRNRFGDTLGYMCQVCEQEVFE